MMRQKGNGKSLKLDTVIGPDTSLQGSIHTKGGITVEGRILGEVEAKGEVVVGSAGRVEANIFADAIVAGGEIDGNIVARRRLEITETGRVTGEIRAGAITVKEGGKVDGCFRMIGDTTELDVIPFEAKHASTK
jgi:cytoskeletal protein CcmA (bactofilin family)